MPKITFIEQSGVRREVEAVVGESLMVAATRAGVEGIIGECGGSAMCATCHCYTAGGPPLPEKEALEAETLEFVAENVRPESRLACQIIVTESLNGAVLKVAA